MSYFFKSLFSSREEPGIKLVVFDFDGTLADTRKLLINIVKKHVAKFNISLTGHLINVFGNAPLHDYLSITGIRNDLVKSVAKSIEEDFVSDYLKIKACKKFNVVKEIKIRKVIVSNNSTEFIDRILKNWRVNYFEKVLGADHFDNKVHAIKHLCNKYKISAEEVVYIGDKDIDVDVARKVGCYSVVVSNSTSWSPRKDIISKKPDYLIKDLGTLPEVIKLINSAQLSSI